MKDDWNRTEAWTERAIGAGIVTAGALGGLMIPIPMSVGPMWSSLHCTEWGMIAVAAATILCGLGLFSGPARAAGAALTPPRPNPGRHPQPHGCADHR